MTGIFLLLGSNLGNREHYLVQARRHLEEMVGVVETASSVYQTEAWQMQQAPAFLNQVLLVNSEMRPQKVLDEILKIETHLGRIRQDNYVSRTIDIDILYYGKQVINLPDLIIPHPRISQRRFVLTPLAEIAPEFQHPLLEQTNLQLLEQCEDPLGVMNYEL